ncbi:hypothetical protein [Symbiopectobacterium purcellii]|uniref:hypothetical protein n=1 Tax=Symbiopectobacterium purcellii TaxID=2871826 RepID=UPI003F87D19F
MEAPVNFSIANRLKNDYILCPDMRQRSIAGCYQNNVAWLYRVFIATPRDIAAQEKRPVLYVLDANAQFTLAVNSYTPTQGPAPVIVGIGYRIDQGYDIPARTRDYTPPAPTIDPDFGAVGEAEQFYQFIQHSKRVA